MKTDQLKIRAADLIWSANLSLGMKHGLLIISSMTTKHYETADVTGCTNQTGTKTALCLYGTYFSMFTGANKKNGYFVLILTRH